MFLTLLLSVPGAAKGANIGQGCLLGPGTIASVASGQGPRQWCRDSSEVLPLEEPALPRYFGTAPPCRGWGSPSTPPHTPFAHSLTSDPLWSLVCLSVRWSTWCCGVLGTGQGWSGRPLPVSCLRQGGMELAATLAACRSAEKAWLSHSTVCHCPLTLHGARCPLLAVSSPSAYILVPAQVFTPRWAPNEDPGCALLGLCFLGVHMGQGMGLASLGL